MKFKNKKLKVKGWKKHATAIKVTELFILTSDIGLRWEILQDKGQHFIAGKKANTLKHLTNSYIIIACVSNNRAPKYTSQNWQNWKVK